MGNFLNTDHLPNLNQEQIDNKNRPTIPSKIQTVIKSLLTTTKSQVQMFQHTILAESERRTNANDPQIIPQNRQRTLSK